MRCEILTQLGDGRWECETCGRLSRKPSSDEPNMQCGAERQRVPLRPGAVGSALYRIVLMLGFRPRDQRQGCGCKEMIYKMNDWGVDGCREHRAEIVAHLQEKYAELSWAEWAAALASAMRTGLVLEISPFDKCGSLVDEAIRLASSDQAEGFFRTR